MAAARDEFADFNLLAAFGLEELENEKMVSTPERTRLVVSTRTGSEDLRRWIIKTLRTSSKIRRLNKLKRQHNGRSQLVQVG